MRKSFLEKGKDTPIERFYGVGEKRAEAFHKIGVFTAADAVYRFPRAYEPRGNVKTTASAQDGEVCSLILTVAGVPKNAVIRKGMTLTKFTGFDGEGNCNLIFFNQTYIKDQAGKGMTFRFFGKVKRERSGVSMTNPIMESVDGITPLRDLVPIYPLTAGITQKFMGSVIRESLEAVRSEKNGIAEYLPYDMRRRLGLCGVTDALAMIHGPRAMEETLPAIRRLAFDELFMFALSMMLYGKNEKLRASEPYQNFDGTAFMDTLPYALTGAQKRTFEAIASDLKSGNLMNRLVIGDVGSGKTVCAAYAVYLALINGKQAAIMAPTEILARQHFGELSETFGAMGYRVALLVGSMTAANKRKTVAALAAREIDLVIGTHALIEDTVAFDDLGLAVIDEQHRFGAAQRSALAKKGRDTHVLTMSATPIPRTLAMVLYCETDVSVIDEMPPGRQKVDTFLVNESYRERLNAFIRKNIEAGGQVYIVCPAVEEEEKLVSESGDTLTKDDLFALGGEEEEKPRLKAAVAFAKLLSEEVFPEYRSAFVHGKLNGKEKDRIMNAFASGDLDILVSTTVIEVGVNVPRATLMIVENAEAFGLSALHQLRGRVGRGTRKSYCILVSDSKTQKAKERLGILCKSNDGFAIAQKDLEMRGPGDFLEQTFGKTRQSGDFDLGIASLEKDVKLLYTAFDEAKRVLAEDPELANEENSALAKALKERLFKRQNVIV
ncbi:MAG: ATP-dependent DNA helicase RecG [Clostridia bacterium]|nr:ATP-dependent DNA helicase RecG [Clostridia bacterium]